MTDKTPSIAYVITTYNRRALLEIALSSVTQQFSEHDKVIIIDDESNDDTEAFCNGLIQTSNQIIYHRLDKTSGVNAARQAAINVVKSTDCDWISYIDDDDYLTKDAHQQFIRDQQKLTDTLWFAYPAIDENNNSLTTTPGSGLFSYIEDYMGKRIIKGDFQHFLHIDIATQCTFTDKFRNAEVWFFWCQVSHLTAMYIAEQPGVVKQYLEEGITHSGFNRDRKLDVAKMKVEMLEDIMSPKQFSKQLRNLGKALVKSNDKKTAKPILIRAIKLNPSLISAYKYYIQSCL